MYATSVVLSYIIIVLFFSLTVFLSIFIPLRVRHKRKAKEAIHNTEPILQSGSLTTLKGTRVLNLRFDFSQSIIKGLLEEDFLRAQCLVSRQGEGWREHWKTTCYKQFLGKFCMKANAVTRVIGISIGEFPEAQYTAVIQIQNIGEDGTISGLMIINDTINNNRVIAIIDRLYGQGGKFGTFENLISDAMERLGTQVGNFIVKNVK